MPQERTPSYFTIGASASKCKVSPPTSKTKANNDTDLFNPLFNFDKSFSDQLFQLTPLDLAQSQPYIDLKILDLGGKVIDDLNVSFFQKQIDFSKINSGERYADRPLMSLERVEISSDQASGTLYYVHVDITLKIHKKDQLSDRTLLGLLFPNCPLLMEYGWNSTNDFLNKAKIKLLMNVVNYEITLDITGQADLVVHCMAFSDVFYNTLIGDLNTLKISNNNTKEEELGGLFTNYNQLTQFLDYLQSLKNNNNNNVNDYSIVLNNARAYKSLENKARGQISKNFSGYLKKLSDKSLRDQTTFQAGVKKKVDTICFHDLVYTICNDTLKSITALIPVNKFEVVYGTFNDQCGLWAGKSIADFPIDYNKFLSSFIKDKTIKGQRLIYVKDFLEGVCRDFMENDEYIMGGVQKPTDPDSKQDKFSTPNMIVNLTNVGDTLTLAIVDAKANVPITTNELPKNKSSSANVESIFAKKNVPIVTISNANSFISEVSFSRITDANIETVLIERALNNSFFSPMDATFNDQLLQAQSSTPLSLPLEGTLKVIGHPAWMPYRAFYLSTGIFLIDAVYSIQKVTHTLSRDGFETTLEIRWN